MEAIDVVRLLLEELDDVGRVYPLCRWDNLSHQWVQNKDSHTRLLSFALERAAREVAAKAGAAI